MEYKSNRIIDGRPRWIIVDINGNIINKKPSKEELKLVHILPHKDGRSEPRRKESYNDTNTCDKIKKIGFSWRKCENKLEKTKHSYREYDSKGNHTGRWICKNCYMNNWHDIAIKYVGDRRTGNQNPDSSNAIGDMFEELNIMRKKGTVNLNKENDNYIYPIDQIYMSQIYPTTELVYLIKGRSYDDIYGMWNFTRLDREWFKEFDILICYCRSKDGKRIERIYEFPKEEIIERKTISIYKNPTDSIGRPVITWHDKYRIKDEEEIRRVNNIWKTITYESK